MFKYFNYIRAVSLLSLVDEHLLSRVFARGDQNVFDDDRGFGKEYKWKYVGQGFEEAQRVEKPIFLVVHRDSCPACQKLKEKFAKSIQLIDLSRNFVMINIPSSADVLSVDKKFYPDGHYVPRIIFYTSQGDIISEAYNRHASDSKFRYFYSSPSEIAEAMRVVLEHHKTNRKM